MRAFGLVRDGRALEAQPPPALSVPRVPEYLGGYTQRPAQDLPSRARDASAKGIFGAGDKNTGAACLAPDALVERLRCTIVMIARHELAPIDPKLPVEQMQFFDAGMSVRRVTRARREPHQHADALVLRVVREQLAFDSRCDLFPFRLGPLPRQRQHRRFRGLFRDAKRKALL